MIDAKQAVQIAKERAAEMLSENRLFLEEIERDLYRDRDVWSITLSYPRSLLTVAPALTRLSADALEYKRFLIDAKTGELVAMKLRELANR